MEINMTEFKKGGSEYISGLISEGIQNGRRCAEVTGEWEIDKAIRIPSNFTVILKDCHLRLGDGVYDNVFVNEHNETYIGRTKEGTDRNISIIGRGRAILDGGNHNGLCEKTPVDARPAPIYKNNLIFFTNVDGFKISGISCINQRWWATNFIYCGNGYIGDINFHSDDRWCDEEGNIHHGLLRDKYAGVCVKNSDGIDLRVGCHDIVIENVTGFTEDDTVALTGLAGKMEADFAVEGMSSDIQNVRIKNVRSAAYCTNVRLLNQGETKLHDIEIDGVYDCSENCDSLDHGNFAVRIGDRHLYGSRHCTKDETYNISVKNVYGAGIAALALAGEIGNLTVYGIETGPNTPMFFDWGEKESR